MTPFYALFNDYDCFSRVAVDLWRRIRCIMISVEMNHLTFTLSSAACRDKSFGLRLSMPEVSSPTNGWKWNRDPVSPAIHQCNMEWWVIALLVLYFLIYIVPFTAVAIQLYPSVWTLSLYIYISNPLQYRTINAWRCIFPLVSCSKLCHKTGLIFHRPYNVDGKIRQHGKGLFYDHLITRLKNEVASFSYPPTAAS